MSQKRSASSVVTEEYSSKKSRVDSDYDEVVEDDLEDNYANHSVNNSGIIFLSNSSYSKRIHQMHLRLSVVQAINLRTMNYLWKNYQKKRTSLVRERMELSIKFEFLYVTLIPR